MQKRSSTTFTNQNGDFNGAMGNKRLPSRAMLLHLFLHQLQVIFIPHKRIFQLRDPSLATRTVMREDGKHGFLLKRMDFYGTLGIDKDKIIIGCDSAQPKRDGTFLAHSKYK